MKYGVREICDVVLKARSTQKIGNKIFYKDEPVLYFDSLKTSSLEGAATTVYAQGGRGNARLMAWEGERTLTFNMEDALISPESFAILTGADITTIEYKTVDIVERHYEFWIVGRLDTSIQYKVYNSITNNSVWVFIQENEIVFHEASYIVQEKDFETIVTDNNSLFIEILEYNDEGEEVLTSKPLGEVREKIIGQQSVPVSVITTHVTETIDKIIKNGNSISITLNNIPSASNNAEIYVMPLKANEILTEPYIGIKTEGSKTITLKTTDDLDYFSNCDSVLVDYYVDKISNIMQIDITPDKFGGTYYLEASTLFKDTNGTDVAAEFVIPKCKIQSNFTFTMASSGDPSTFNFVLDAFPEYTRFDKTKKVLAAIQIINSNKNDIIDNVRKSTPIKELI